jgi:KDO2-lipid IV(A) lauroyltransferase
MTIEARNIINSPFGLNLAYWIGRNTPQSLGHRIAQFAADRISSRRDWKMVQAVRLNQWVVRGENISGAALDEAVQMNFRNTARSIFDLYHNINNPAVFRKLIDVQPIAEQFLKRPEYAERGLVLAGLHVGSFDFIGQAAALEGVKAMYLGLPKMNAGYQKQVEMRREKGMNILPTSNDTIRHAIKYLRSGGMVVTGIDRPDESLPYHPRFFGRPAPLPVHHVFIALKAQVPVILGVVFWQPDNRYHLRFSEPIEMEPQSDRHVSILYNAEKILSVAADFIRYDPSQWAMTFPVWPDVLAQVPQ